MFTRSELSRNGAAAVGTALKVAGSRRLDTWRGIAFVAAGQTVDTAAALLGEKRTVTSEIVDFAGTVIVTQAAKQEGILSTPEARWHAGRGIGAVAVDILANPDSDVTPAINTSAGVISTLATAIAAKLDERGYTGFAGYFKGFSKATNTVDVVSMGLTVQGSLSLD